MKKNDVLKVNGFCLILIFLSINITGICQTTKPINNKTDVQRSSNFKALNLSAKVGDATPSTGMEQIPPQISNVAVVAP
ncbi:MAG TPA: hypothetical protein VFE71_00050, partial [Bacteroidales bacterium]|nr:hypothetical protein [Bacteroidales bacterium]